MFSIDEMCNWYVEHIPTYASKIQEEKVKEYNGDIKNYIVYELNSKIYNVISKKSEAKRIDNLSQNLSIVSAKESAILNMYFRDNKSIYAPIIFNTRKEKSIENELIKLVKPIENL